MEKNTDISQWKVPQWHEDCGDIKREFDLLKKLALAIEKLDIPYSCTLNTEEEGYMSLDLQKDEKIVGEIHIVDPVIDKYGCFFDMAEEEFPDIGEFYTTEIKDITLLISYGAKNENKKIQTHLHEVRKRHPVYFEEVPELGKGGFEEVKEIIRKRVAQGGGYEGSHCGEPAIFFNDGEVKYVFKPNGEFWTILSNKS